MLDTQTIFTKSYKLHNTTRYYENELKVTHAQGQIHKKHKHEATNKKDTNDKTNVNLF